MVFDVVLEVTVLVEFVVEMIVMVPLVKAVVIVIPKKMMEFLEEKVSFLV